MLRNFTGILLTVVRPLSSYLDKASWLVLFLMMFYTVIDVLALKVAGYSLLGTVEMTALMMVICVFFSFAQTGLEDGHIRVDFVYNRMGERAQTICDFITQALCTLLFGFIGWSSILNGLEKYESSEISMDLLLPLYPFAFVASVGCCLIAVILFIKTLLVLDKVINL
ncbi:TRAP transporter small permease [bacterium]|nr:TRAP transporter small permease [bacterium]